MRLPSIGHVLQQRALETPGRIAYRFETGDTNRSQLSLNLSDAQVFTHAVRLAERIQRIAEPGDRALLIFAPGLEFIIGFYACAFARVVAVPATYPRANRNSARLRSIVNDSRPTIAISSNSTLDLMGEAVSDIPPNVKWVTVDLTDQSDAELNPGDVELALAGSEKWSAEVGATDIAFLQYTSGSTAEPKGVIVSHANLMHNLEVIECGFNPRSFEQGDGEKTGVFWLPAYHDMGLIGTILMPMFAGWQSVLMPPALFLRRPSRWLQLLTEYRAMLTGAPNFALDLCVDKISEEDRASLDLSQLRLLFCGAEPIQIDSIRRFERTFAECGFRGDAWYPCYGLAESTLMATGPNGSMAIQTLNLNRNALADNRVERIDESTPESNQQVQLISCGQARIGQQVAIVEPNQGRRLSEGELGEIWIAGESVAQGYWNRETESAEVFGLAIDGESDGRWLRTGDLGFVDNGELYVTGRTRDLIIIRGQNHYPQDIEQIVSRSHPALLPHGAAAFSLSSDSGEQLVVIQEVDRHYRSADFDAVLAKIRSSVSHHLELDVQAIALIRQASLPRTTSGKVQRTRCRELYLEGELREIARWTASPKERADKPVSNSELAPVGELLRSGDVDRLTAAVEKWLVNWIENRCNEPGSPVEPDTPFTETGLDSLSAVELGCELEQWLEIEVSPIHAWNHPTSATLARHLAETALELNRAN